MDRKVPRPSQAGMDLRIDNNAQWTKGAGVPPIRELLGKLREHQVPVYV